MNRSIVLFVVATAYLSLGQFLGNVIFVFRTWYLYPELFSSAASTVSRSSSSETTDTSSSLMSRLGLFSSFTSSSISASANHDANTNNDNKDGSNTILSTPTTYLRGPVSSSDSGGGGLRLLEEDALAPSPIVADSAYPPTFSILAPNDDSMYYTTDISHRAPSTSSGGQETIQSTTATSDSLMTSLPAFVIGFASSIVLCAGFAILMELRDRCRNKNGGVAAPSDGSVIFTVGSTVRGGHPRLQLVTMDGQHVQTVLAPSLSGGSNSVWLSTVDPSSRSIRGSDGGRIGRSEDVIYDRRAKQHPVTMMDDGVYLHGHILRPQPVDLPEHLFEDVSLSPVSTMTASVAMESTNTANGNGKLITELQDSHRVSYHTTLRSLVNLADIPAASVSSQSSSSVSVISHKMDRHTDTPYQEQPDSSVLPVIGSPSKLSAFDAGGTTRLSPSIGSVMADFSEEDESGWTSSAGQSDSSSDVSIGTYLKSICSTKSKCSVHSVESNKSSVLFGEKCLAMEDVYHAVTPKKASKEERREDDSLEFSPDASSISNISRTDPSTDHQEETSSGPDSIDIANQSEDGNNLFSSDDKEELIVKDDIKGWIENNHQITRHLDQLFERSWKEIDRDHGSLSNRSNDTVKSVSLQDEVISASDGLGSLRSCVRSVYLTPVAGCSTKDVGIDIDDASCPASNPMIIFVQEGSHFASRIFVGDVILAVNDMDTTGWNAEEVKTSFVCIKTDVRDEIEDEKQNVDDLEAEEGDVTVQPTQPIKLTVMSTRSDGSETGSTATQESTDDLRKRH